jgi:mono/diheme cytochrome c family protein
MKSLVPILAAVGAVAVCVFALGSFASHAFGNSARQSSAQAAVERGRYIVHQVGMCIDCHSPRDKTGQFIEGKHLTGSPLDFVATIPMPWMGAAPKIAGLPAGFTAEDTVHFLMTGQRPNGRPAPLPPMPPYRMNRADAEAVTAYLRSLAPANP